MGKIIYAPGKVVLGLKKELSDYKSYLAKIEKTRTNGALRAMTKVELERLNRHEESLRTLIESVEFRLRLYIDHENE